MAVPLPTARELGLPRAARDLYDRLAGEPPGEWSQLEARALAHARSFESAERSEFLPLREARALAERLPELAKFARASADASSLHLVWVVGRYFEISTDGTHDYTIGGLDDDVALFNAVARWIRADQLCIAQD